MHDRHHSSSRYLRLAIRAALSAVLAVGVVVAAFPVARGWTTPPTYSRESARRAVEEARSVGASQWATRALLQAETKLQDAEIEFRRQELRLIPLRDFREARNRFHDAEQGAANASELATRFRSESIAAATAEVAAAACVVARTDEFYRLVRPVEGPGRLIRGSKLLTKEAELLLAQGEYGLAQIRASEAVAQAGLARERMRDELERFVDRDAVRRWHDEENETIVWSRRTGETAVVVNKDKGVLTLYLAGRSVRTYDVEIGLNHLQRKIAAGDAATPEGRYRVKAKRGVGETQYHKALELDYPNEEDYQRLRQALEQGLLPASSSPGEWIEIHGDGGRGWDWTDGCIALENADMDDLFPRVGAGTPVTIIGSDGDEGRFSTLARILAKGRIENGCQHD